MTITSIHCPILGGHVTLVSDFEGNVSRINCAHYDAATGRCRMKAAAFDGGPLSQLLERVATEALDTKSPRCVLRPQVG